MDHDRTHRLSKLPTYEWCGVHPGRLAVGFPGVATPPHPRDSAPIPPLFSDATGESLPLVQTSTAAGRAELLVPLDDPQIRDLGAYWHEGWPYAIPDALLREGARAALVRAVGLLPPGFGVGVWDAWRDPRLQRELHELAYRDDSLEPGFVSPPSADPATPPPHATGGTVDLTLTWQSIPLNLGTRFDEFVPAAKSAFLETDVSDVSDVELIRDLRRLLREVMVSAGFVQLDCEWWHFEFGTRLWAAVRHTQPLYPAALPAQLPTSTAVVGKDSQTNQSSD
jgi:D-alanyl-D-alanine dipeptidase